VNNGVGSTRLRRSIDCHPHKHPLPEIGNAKRQGQKDWGKDGGFDRGCGACAMKKTAKISEHCHPHCASLNVPPVTEPVPPPPVVPGRQPFWNIGTPASSRYLETNPKQVPWTCPLPEKFRV
jgi:hypothetical protein